MKKHSLCRTIILVMAVFALSFALSSCKKYEFSNDNNYVVDSPTQENSFIDEHTPSAQQLSAEIEITLDNWYQYFEVKESPLWEENAFGEAETLYARYCLFLKDEYRDKVDEMKESTVAFAFEYDWILADIEVDYDAKEFSYTGIVHEDSQGHEETTLAVYTGMLIDEENCGIICSCGEGYFTDDNDVKIPNCYQFTNVEVTRVEGSIFLFDEN